MGIYAAKHSITGRKNLKKPQNNRLKADDFVKLEGLRREDGTQPDFIGAVKTETYTAVRAQIARNGYKLYGDFFLPAQPLPSKRQAG